MPWSDRVLAVTVCLWGLRQFTRRRLNEPTRLWRAFRLRQGFGGPCSGGLRCPARRRLNEPVEAMARFVGGFASSLQEPSSRGAPATRRSQCRNEIASRIFPPSLERTGRSYGGLRRGLRLLLAMTAGVTGQGAGNENYCDREDAVAPVPSISRLWACFVGLAIRESFGALFRQPDPHRGLLPLVH
jgi:hypothetical protein